MVSSSTRTLCILAVLGLVLPALAFGPIGGRAIDDLWQTGPTGSAKALFEAPPAGCSTASHQVLNNLGTNVPHFDDQCYHMRHVVNTPDDAVIDVIIVPPVSPLAERDYRLLAEGVRMWESGINELAPGLGLGWMTGLEFNVFVEGVDDIPASALADPEILIVTTDAAPTYAGIGIDVPVSVCHGIPNPIPSMQAFQATPGWDAHHGAAIGTMSSDCNPGGSDGGGRVCVVANNAMLVDGLGPLLGSTPEESVDPAARARDFFDLNTHEFGHCLGIGHVGDAEDHRANVYPRDDIMSYENDGWNPGYTLCVSTLDVVTLALHYDSYLGQPDVATANGGAFQIMEPVDWSVASPTGLPADCPQPDLEIALGIGAAGPGEEPEPSGAGITITSPVDGSDIDVAQTLEVTGLFDPDVAACEGRCESPLTGSTNVYQATLLNPFAATPEQTTVVAGTFVDLSGRFIKSTDPGNYTLAATNQARVTFYDAAGTSVFVLPAPSLSPDCANPCTSDPDPDDWAVNVQWDIDPLFPAGDYRLAVEVGGLGPGGDEWWGIPSIPVRVVGAATATQAATSQAAIGATSPLPHDLLGTPAASSYAEWRSILGPWANPTIAWEDPGTGGNGDYVFIDSPADGSEAAGPTVLAGRAGNSATDPDGCQVDCGGEPFEFGAPLESHLRPGDWSEVCTLNFVFEHQGRYFFGSAAHCAATGSNTDTNGCITAPQPIGSAQSIGGSGAPTITTTLAYSSWRTMQRVGETNSDACFGNDFALFEVKPADVPKIHPAVRMYGGPTGLGTIESVAFGDEVRGYGRSNLHDDTILLPAESSVLNPKVGYSLGQSNGGWSYWVYLLPQGVPGDSGGGIMDIEGKALGAASTISAAGASNNYANIARALDYMRAKEGWAPTLVTWDGFDPEPRVDGLPVGDGASLPPAPEAAFVPGRYDMAIVPEAGVAATSTAPPLGPATNSLYLHANLDDTVTWMNTLQDDDAADPTTVTYWGYEDSPTSATHTFVLDPALGFPVDFNDGEDVVFALSVGSGCCASYGTWTATLRNGEAVVATASSEEREWLGYGPLTMSATPTAGGLDPALGGLEFDVTFTGVGTSFMQVGQGGQFSRLVLPIGGVTVPTVGLSVNGADAGTADVATDGTWSKEIDFGAFSAPYVVVATYGDATDTATYGSGGGGEGQPTLSFAATTTSIAAGESITFSLVASHGSAGNGAPTAAFSHLATGLLVTFDSSASDDPDDDPLDHAWTFGDLGTGTGVSPSHTYAAPGTYSVTLTVDDGNGGSDSVTHDVAVAGDSDASWPYVLHIADDVADAVLPPNELDYVEVSQAGEGADVVIEVGMPDRLPMSGWAGSLAALSGAIQLHFTFGDVDYQTGALGVSSNGALDPGMAFVCEPNLCTLTVTPSSSAYQAIQDGTTLQVQSGEGNPANLFLSGGLLDDAVPDGGPAPLTPGQATLWLPPALTMSSAGPCDPGPCDSGSGDESVAVKVDGETVAIERFPRSAEAYAFDYTHTFATAGSFEVTAVFVDDEASQVTKGPVTITVTPPANTPPEANAGADQVVNEGDEVSLSGSASDADGAIVSYAWSKVSGPALTLAGANTATATFTAPDVRATTLVTLRLTVTDDDGATDSDDVVVTVQPVVAPNGNTIEVTLGGHAASTALPTTEAAWAVQLPDVSDLPAGDHELTATAYDVDGIVLAQHTITVIVPGPPADTDGDGVSDGQDNCPEAANADQADLDGDGLGDVCDDDMDGDGLDNELEALLGTDPGGPLEGEVPTVSACAPNAGSQMEFHDYDGDGIMALYATSRSSPVTFSVESGAAVGSAKQECWIAGDVDDDGMPRQDALPPEASRASACAPNAGSQMEFHDYDGDGIMALYATSRSSPVTFSVESGAAVGSAKQECWIAGDPDDDGQGRLPG